MDSLHHYDYTHGHVTPGHTDCFPHNPFNPQLNLIANKAQHTNIHNPEPFTLVAKGQTLHSGNWNGGGSVQIDGHGNHQESGSVNYDHGSVTVGGTVSNSGTFNGGNSPSIQIGGTIHF